MSLVLIPGCDLVKSSLQRDLDAARARWERADIRSYEFRLRVGCFCPPNIIFPVIMTVQNGVNTDAEYAQEPKEITTDFFKQYDTIDKLFEVVQKAIDDRVDSLTVVYESANGYPKSINIDRIKDAVDDEIAFFVESFAPTS